MRSQEGKDFFNLSPSFSEPFPALPLSFRRGGWGGEVSLDINFCQEFFIANEILYRTFQVLRHLLNDVIALGVDGRVVEWVLGIGNTEEACTLLEGCITQTLHLLELGT